MGRKEKKSSRLLRFKMLKERKTPQDIRILFNKIGGNHKN